MSKQSLYWVDKTRVWASFAVVVIHINSLFINVYGKEIEEYWSLANFTGSLVRWAVPVFVILSGYLLLSSETVGIRSFLSKKIKRILFPLIGWCVIYYLYFFFRAEYLNGSPLVLSSTVNNFLLGKPYYHLYFLFLIFGLYLITPIIKIFIHNAKKNAVFYLTLFSISTSAVPIFLDYFLPQKWFEVVVLGNESMFNYFIYYLGYFLAGFYIVKYVDISKKNVLIAWIVFFTSVFITVLGTCVYHDTGYFYSYLSINVFLMSFSVFYLFLFYQNPISLISQKVIKFIAPNTLGIYLIHPILFELFPFIRQLSFKVGPLIGTFIISITVYFVSLLLIVAARKIPIVKLIV